MQKTFTQPQIGNKRFMDIKPGDELYRADRFQSTYGNVINVTVDNIRKHGGHAGLTLILYSNKTGTYSFPLFEDELELDSIVLVDTILAASLDALKQAMFKDIAEYNKRKKIATAHA